MFIKIFWYLTLGCIFCSYTRHFSFMVPGTKVAEMGRSTHP